MTTRNLRELEEAVGAIIAGEVRAAVEGERQVWLEVIRRAGLDVAEAEKVAASIRAQKPSAV